MEEECETCAAKQAEINRLREVVRCLNRDLKDSELEAREAFGAADHWKLEAKRLKGLFHCVAKAVEGAKV